jgi:hypothetical protein
MDEEATTEHNWSSDLEDLLRAVEHNSSFMAMLYKANYERLNQQIKYFKLPVITISSINSIFAVWLATLASQTVVSSINCLLSLICSILVSLELYLNIGKRIEMSVNSYRDFYLLATKINNTLMLDAEHRQELDARQFLQKVISEYNNLFASSEILDNGEYRDKLLTLEPIKIENPMFSPRATPKIKVEV